MKKGNRFLSFFSNLFDTASIIDSRLQVFCRFVIAAVTAANVGGIFDDVLPGLTEAYTAYYGKSKDKTITKALKKASTGTLNDAIRLFANAVRSKHHLIASIYPEGSPEYKEFFPFGLSYMSKLNRMNVLEAVNAFAVTAIKYKTQLGGDSFGTLFTGYQTNITTALTAQINKKSAVKTITKDMITMRTPLEDALMKVMFAVGLKFWPVVNKCLSFFDFDLLFAEHHTTGNNTKGSLGPLATRNCLKELINERNIFILKAGKFPLHFFLSATKDGPAIGNTIEVITNATYTAPFQEFGAENGLYLNVKNISDNKASWEVRVEG